MPGEERDPPSGSYKIALAVKGRGRVGHGCLPFFISAIGPKAVGPDRLSIIEEKKMGIRIGRAEKEARLCRHAALRFTGNPSLKLGGGLRRSWRRGRAQRCQSRNEDHGPQGHDRILNALL